MGERMLRPDGEGDQSNANLHTILNRIINRLTGFVKEKPMKHHKRPTKREVRETIQRVIEDREFWEKVAKEDREFWEKVAKKDEKLRSKK